MKPTRGRPTLTVDRAHVSKRQRDTPNGRRIRWYEAAVRLAKGGRVYIRAYDTRREAVAACAHYLATGEKPPRKTGARFTHAKPRRAAERQPQARQRAAAPPAGESRIDALRRIYHNACLY